MESGRGDPGLGVQVFDGLVARHPAPQPGGGIRWCDGAGQQPMEDHLALIQKDRRAAVGTGQKYLAFVGVEHPAALGAVDFRFR